MAFVEMLFMLMVSLKGCDQDVGVDGITQRLRSRNLLKGEDDKFVMDLSVLWLNQLLYQMVRREGKSTLACHFLERGSFSRYL